MRGRIKLGKIGETMTAQYLEKKGHIILETNWRVGHLEVDLITLYNNGLHFVEVKSINVAKVDYNLQDKVGFLKQQRIAKAAQKFILTYKKGKYSNLEIMFDVATVLFDKGKVELEYFEQAYIPTFF